MARQLENTRATDIRSLSNNLGNCFFLESWGRIMRLYEQDSFPRSFQGGTTEYRLSAMFKLPP